MAQKQTKMAALMLGALGVVFGDIGTSPLYALKIVFGLSNDPGLHSQNTIYGLISLLLWTVTLIVSVKYIGFIMRASNKGEGGIMALVALILSSKLRSKSLLVLLGVVGVALFYGDSVVTPAISVLSAVEGLQIVESGLHRFIVPITLVILALFFSIQKYGTGAIGRLFGPVMLLWFGTIGAAGLWRIFQHPDILRSLSPFAATSFIANHPFAAFISMGAIVLAITGAEALYADMGHFGRPPIARTWFLFVFPALALCYMGQGALLLHEPNISSNPFFALFPSALLIPAVVLATAATLIASQSVISGAFSLTRQAIQLNLLPRMVIRQTSAQHIGQIYIPFVNFLLFILVVLLVIIFKSSEQLAGAYGIAVSGTLAVDTILFVVTAYSFWHWSRPVVALFCAVFVTVDVILIAANVTKIAHGGWLPLAIAALALVVITTWAKGRSITAKERRAMEEPLQSYITGLQTTATPVTRVPGQAVYIGHHAGLTPTALRTSVEEMHELHEKVVIIYVETSTEAHVPANERAVFNELGYADGISQVTITYGFHDSPNIPRTLDSIRSLSPELDFDSHKAVYFISLSRPVVSKLHTMSGWQKALYALMSRNALSASDYYHLPLGSTVEIRTLIKI